MIPRRSFLMLFCVLFNSGGVLAQETSVSSDLKDIFDSMPSVYDKYVRDRHVEMKGGSRVRFYGFATALSLHHIQCNESEPSSAQCQADISIQQIRALTIPDGDEIYFDPISARMTMTRVPQELSRTDRDFSAASLENVILRRFRFRDGTWDGLESTAADRASVLSYGRRRLEAILSLLQDQIFQAFSGRSVTELFIEKM